MKESETAGQHERQRWMAVLAKAAPSELEQCWNALSERPGYACLRKPEAGLVMVRGRAGGTGARFNLGEMTATRCTLQLEDGTIGVAYVRGRSKRHAELAAIFDALMQVPSRRAEIRRKVVQRLADLQTERRLARARKIAATRVDFFTMVRGENP